MQDSFDVTTIIFLALAVFVIWRLRSVLGQKTGAERSPFKPVDRSRTEPQARADGDNVVRLPGADRVQPAPAPAAGLPGGREIRLRDHHDRLRQRRPEDLAGTPLQGSRRSVRAGDRGARAQP